MKYGLLTAAALIAYFLLMALLGLTHIVELRFLNGIILAVGVVLALRGYKVKEEGNVKYFKGLGTGIITSIVATVIFATFMLIYLKIAGEAFVELLTAEQYLGQRIEVTPGIVIFTVLMLEGLISGVMISFIAMQFFKRPQHQMNGSR